MDEGAACGGVNPALPRAFASGGFADEADSQEVGARTDIVQKMPCQSAQKTNCQTVTISPRRCGTRKEAG